jgi:hypothetical protein
MTSPREVDVPVKLWPPPRRANGMLFSRAQLTALATSPSVRHRATARGEMPLYRVFSPALFASNPGCPRAMTRPRSARSSDRSCLRVGRARPAARSSISRSGRTSCSPKAFGVGPTSGRATRPAPTPTEPRKKLRRSIATPIIAPGSRCERRDSLPDFFCCYLCSGRKIALLIDDVDRRRHPSWRTADKAITRVRIPSRLLLTDRRRERHFTFYFPAANFGVSGFWKPTKYGDDDA